MSAIDRILNAATTQNAQRHCWTTRVVLDRDGHAFKYIYHCCSHCSLSARAVYTGRVAHAAWQERDLLACVSDALCDTKRTDEWAHACETLLCELLYAKRCCVIDVGGWILQV